MLPSFSILYEELGFFDNYIIPLAKKLKECQVFGPFSDDYLNYAVLNRAEWEEKGESIVQGYIDFVKSLEQNDQSQNLSAASKNEDNLDDTNRSGVRSTASTVPMNGPEDTDASTSESPSSPRHHKDKFEIDKFDMNAFVYDRRRRSQPDNHKKIETSDSGIHAGGVGRRFRRFSMR